ncbi:hypothetical protein D3C71_2246330 [compost metagenome]
MTPKIIGQAKLFTASPPQIAMGTSENAVAIEVKMHRASTWLIDMSIRSENGIDLYLRRFSRMRS